MVRGGAGGSFVAKTGGSVKIPLLRARELRTLHTFLGSSTWCLLLREQFEENAEEKRNYKKKGIGILMRTIWSICQGYDVWYKKAIPQLQ